jgi:hypothetical protein
MEYTIRKYIQFLFEIQHFCCGICAFILEHAHYNSLPSNSGEFNVSTCVSRAWYNWFMYTLCFMGIFVMIGLSLNGKHESSYLFYDMVICEKAFC